MELGTRGGQVRGDRAHHDRHGYRRRRGAGRHQPEANPHDRHRVVAGRPGRLPFADGAFDLAINRHESFRGDEAYRVLAPGGTFLTLQVDYHDDDALFGVLGLDPPDATAATA
jgi:SAM-dependent methyltransferase